MPKAVRLDRYGHTDVLEVKEVGRPTLSPDRILVRTILQGRRSAIGSGVKEAIGKEPRSFETFAHDYAPMFN
jgi:hypothetical protein